MKKSIIELQDINCTKEISKVSGHIHKHRDLTRQFCL